MDKAFKLDFPHMDIEVTLEPYHVRKMLLSFLRFELKAEDLQKWAEFLTFNFSSYSVYNPDDDDEVYDYFETLYHVIQMLSTPEIDGAITPERILEYLDRLKMYPPD